MKCPHCGFEWGTAKTIIKVKECWADYRPIILAGLLCAAVFSGLGLWLLHG